MAASSPSASKSTSDATTTTTTTTAAATTPLPHPPSPFQRMDTLPKTQRGLISLNVFNVAMLPVPVTYKEETRVLSHLSNQMIPGFVVTYKEEFFKSVVIFKSISCWTCLTTDMILKTSLLWLSSNVSYFGNLMISNFVVTYKEVEVLSFKVKFSLSREVTNFKHSFIRPEVDTGVFSSFPCETVTARKPTVPELWYCMHVIFLAGKRGCVMTPLRVPSFKQLSNAFAQFDNLQVRSKKHLTRKNISLLEEVFSIKSIDEGSEEDEGSKPSSTLKEDETSVMISGLKLTLKSDPVRTDNARKRIKQIVDQGIEKLHKAEANDGANDPDDQNKLDSRLNMVKSSRIERALVLSDIVDKLNKARNEEDLKSCLEMKAQLYNQSIMSTDTEIEDPGALNEESTGATVISRQVAYHPSPKMLTQLKLIKKHSTN
ncbi:hypothetical protein CXB51_025451 [Gossypium anomalum]|uniref:Uncharacterized protein n=1 Tax=Gossypium anomalum TaxID=47600 RepID=A0A8J5YJI1_9ROSI|nr:hypothetical protein CXB51_025451 [Gossypium anomalum]